jgi:hypothetical protein
MAKRAVAAENSGAKSVADADTAHPVETSTAKSPLEGGEPAPAAAPTTKPKKKKRRRKRKVVKKVAVTLAQPNGSETSADTKAETESKRLQRPFPQKTLEEALVVPEAIRDKNQGNPFATADVADACGYKNHRSGSFFYLSVSARDYGLTVGTYNTDKIELAPLGRRIVSPNTPDDERKAKVEAFFNIDVFKKVYQHFGGSKFPPENKKYYLNTLRNDFGLDPDLHDDFLKVFIKNCEFLKIENGLGEVSVGNQFHDAQPADIRVVGQAKGKFDRTAFVIMPFTEKGIQKRSGGFFSEVLRTLITPAGNDAGFAIETAEGQGSDVIQSTIINQLLSVELVIADLTDHNPNVLFELGIRIAKELPVALVKAKDTDKIFDVDNMMRYFPYDPNLWMSTVAEDRVKLTEHIKGAWDNRSRYRTYMQILTGDAQKPVK